jgi:hypothetical protein
VGKIQAISFLKRQEALLKRLHPTSAHKAFTWRSISPVDDVSLRLAVEEFAVQANSLTHCGVDGGVNLSK